MVFFKIFIFVSVLFVHLVNVPVDSENVGAGYDKDKYADSTQKVLLQDEYCILEKEVELFNRVTLALEYERWINDPLEDVFNKFQGLYAEPLLSEIKQSVSEFREIPTSWPYSYRVDSVCLVAKEDEKIYLIADVLEILNDEVIDKLRILVVVNRDLKIIDKQFLY